MGRGRADNLASLISGQPGHAADLDEAVRLAPQSYLATANRAYGYDRLDRHAEAAEFYEQAIALTRALKKQMSEVAMLFNVCTTYSSLNQREKAISYCERSLAAAQEMKNPDAESFALYALGATYYGQGQYEKSAGYFERALTIARESRNQVILGSTLFSLGNVYYALNRYESAVAYYTQTVQKIEVRKARICSISVFPTVRWVYTGRLLSRTSRRWPLAGSQRIAMSRPNSFATSVRRMPVSRIMKPPSRTINRPWRSPGAEES